ncbi:MAG: WD40 repeat domain-containing protein [Candidatus Sulfotelmatobacter sp.]
MYLHHAASAVPCIRVWNRFSQHEEPALHLAPGRVEGLAFSPDGQTIASCGSSLTIWNFQSRQPTTELAQGPSGFSNCVDFSPSGRFLASGSGYQSEPGGQYEDCGVRLWDSATGGLIAFLPHERPVHSLRFSPGGGKIVAGGESGELLIWEVESSLHQPSHG